MEQRRCRICGKLLGEIDWGENAYISTRGLRRVLWGEKWVLEETCPKCININILCSDEVNR